MASVRPSLVVIEPRSVGIVDGRRPALRGQRPVLGPLQALHLDQPPGEQRQHHGDDDQGRVEPVPGVAAAQHGPGPDPHGRPWRQCPRRPARTGSAPARARRAAPARLARGRTPRPGRGRAAPGFGPSGFGPPGARTSVARSSVARSPGAGRAVAGGAVPGRPVLGGAVPGRAVPGRPAPARGVAPRPGTPAGRPAPAVRPGPRGRSGPLVPPGAAGRPADLAAGPVPVPVAGHGVKPGTGTTFGSPAMWLGCR